MNIILIILLILLLFGGGYGLNTGHVAFNNPLGIILLVILVIILLGLVLPFTGYRYY